MFFQAISTFQFKTESIQSHAFNIKKLSEWISIKECHLGLLHCHELTAIAFGFKTASDLKQALSESDFSTLSISPTIETDLAKAIQKFSETIPFMLLKDSDLKQNHYQHLLSVLSLDGEQQDTPLVECQKFWKDWQSKFAKFLTKYFKETHGRFDWFNCLELIDLNCVCRNALALCYGDHEYTFTNLAIYNHLITQYAGDYGNYIQGLTKKVLFDKNINDRTYIISESLIAYIEDNWDHIAFLRENTYDLNLPKVIAYDAKSKEAKLNLILCKKRLVDNFYCSVNYKGFNFGLEEGTYKSFIFEKLMYEKPFSFTFPYFAESHFMRHLNLFGGVEVTQDDFVCAEVSKSFAIQKLLEHEGHSFVTNGQFSEIIFDLKWDRKEIFDITPHSFKLNETFTVDYLFKKALNKPSLRKVSQDRPNFEMLQSYLKLIINCRVHATLEISIKDSKISIELSNIKTKLSRFANRIPVKSEFYNLNVETGRAYTYHDAEINMLISGLQNRNSFKKMLDSHPYVGVYKQFMLKNLIADIYRSHQHAQLKSLTAKRH